MRMCDLQVSDNETQSLEIIKQSTVQQTSQLVVVHMPSPVATMVPLPKLPVKREKPAIAIPEKQISPPHTGKAELYQQRKFMLTECRELFTALMRLPDKDLQQKILKVINEHRTVEYRSIATQTEELNLQEIQTYIIQEVAAELVTINPSSSCNNEDKTNMNGTVIGDTSVDKKKRKRKRKVSLPQANKVSRVARHTAKMSKPTTLSTSKGSNNSSLLSSNSNENPTKRLRGDSFAISDCSSDIFNNIEEFNTFDDSEHSKKQLLTNLVKDIILSNIELENGLLPIHDTIIKNQSNNLKKQIYIWKDHKKVDLNELITNEDEDLLQLAILNTCDPAIINLLLDAGLNPNCLDADSNTILHLAILNDINVLSLEHLMKRVDLKLLVTLNDDGYTPLHLAVRQDRYLLAESLINILDERLAGHIFYKREIDKYETDENILKRRFKEFYEKICFLMEIEEENAYIIQNHDLKQKLLQAGDRRSGNTSLYFAIENKSEHLVYFLLAHLTDPRTENLSGQDCKTYFSEFGKSLYLSLNIDNAMEKVIKLLS